MIKARNIVALVGAQRLARFTAAGFLASIGTAMHEWNFRAAGAILATAGRMEVLVRHAVSEQLTNLGLASGSTNWPLGVPLDPHESRVIRRAYKETSETGHAPIKPEEVVEQVPLGFWLQLMSNRYHTRLWVPAIRHGFPHLPGTATEGREAMRAWLERAVSLRNLAAHVHPLHVLDPKDAIEPFEFVAAAISSEAAEWVVESSQISQVWGARPAPDSARIPPQNRDGESGA